MFVASSEFVDAAAAQSGALGFPAVAYLVAIAVAFVQPWASIAIYVGVAIVWLIPDRRIERVAARSAEHS